jgi:F-box-like
MRSIIDRDIARLQESIRALKSRRNELSPISRLPTEILCSIFFSLIEGSIFYSSLNPNLWINFSQVSQHWRSTALSAPELWTQIPYNFPHRWVQERLIRSKMAKLTIGYGYSFTKSNPIAIATVRSCLNEMNRVEKLNLSVDPGLLEEISRDLPKSAPQLHTLRIGSSFTFSMDEDFFYDTERLQRVELSNCKISWDSKLLTGLTCLSLEHGSSLDRYHSLETNSSESIIQILYALQRMPALTDLRLINSIPDESEGPSTYPVVNLPCLRNVCISSDVGALTTVLRHITIPHSAILDLECRDKQHTQIDFSNFLSVLAKKFLSSLVIRNLGLLILEDYDTNGLRFTLSTTAINQDCFPSSPISSHVELFLTWPLPHPHNHVKALTYAFDAMSLPFLTQLDISTDHNIDSQTWVKTFGKLPLLKQVQLHGFALNSFLEALVYKTKAAEKSETAYHDVSFPELRRIDLGSTYFFTTEVLERLLDCLMERCERKAEVRVLGLDNCYRVSSDDVEILKEVVVDVIWDGIEKEYSDYEA